MCISLNWYLKTPTSPPVSNLQLFYQDTKSTKKIYIQMVKQKLKKIEIMQNNL